MSLKRAFYILFLGLAFTACKSPQARKPVTQKSGSYINESIVRNKKLVAREEEKIKEIIKEDSSKNYIASTQGFWYYYNKKSTDSSNTKSPEYGDTVNFDYSISTLEGKPIYAEGELPARNYVMDKQELFGGLREGLKLMKEGETVTFLFPSHKAFGYYGDKNKIGTNVPIITQVTLNSITKKDNPNPEN
ncbi:MAG: gliding motility-associated peptidyl-prolyl isomerase GldI [Gillisia sp.]